MRFVLAGMLCASAFSAVSVATENRVHWGYEGQGGPAHWGSLDPAFAACRLGARQSPIDLAGAETRDLADIVFDYAPSPVNVLNNGHTIQVNYAPGSGITVDGVRFELLQFHFHRRSEHTVDSAQLPMELHLVHRSHGGALAVVGVLLREGRANEALAPIWRHLPAAPVPATLVEGTVDADALLPVHRTTWRYGGSLTTPPCTEGVSWLVMTEPVALSAEQIRAFGAIFPDNYRPTQPLNDRRLERDGDAQ